MSSQGSKSGLGLEIKDNIEMSASEDLILSRFDGTPVLNRPVIGQYTYDSFEDVISQIKRISEKIGGGLQRDFDDYIEVRGFYLSQGDLHTATCIENVIKNHVGIRRLVEDYPDLTETRAGQFARFHEGRLLGWRGDENDVITLPGIIGYEL